jgi:hypothetical protein
MEKRASSDVERPLATDGFFADEISVETAPSRDDSYEVRATWAREAVALAAAQNIDERRARIALPDDIRPSHFWEVEFQSALVDPVAYARSMRENPRVLN